MAKKVTTPATKEAKTNKTTTAKTPATKATVKAMVKKTTTTKVEPTVKATVKKATTPKQTAKTKVTKPVAEKVVTEKAKPVAKTVVKKAATPTAKPAAKAKVTKPVAEKVVTAKAKPVAKAVVKKAATTKATPVAKVKPTSKAAVKPAAKKITTAKAKPAKVADKTADEKLLDAIVDGILDKKGKNIVVLDMRPAGSSMCDFFVVCHATSNTQADAIADSVEEMVRKTIGEKPWHTEGFQNAEWILLDYVTVVVHVFQEPIREFFRLEELWADATSKRIEESFA